MIPNVPQMQEWTGDRVRQIAGQGDLYIRTTYPLNLDGLNDVRHYKFIISMFFYYYTNTDMGGNHHI